MTAATRPLSSKGRQTRAAIEDAARILFAKSGFHATTLGDITAAAGRSPAVFYRYYRDKEELLAALAESFLRELADLPPLPVDGDFVTAAVRVYWERFTPNIGIMLAIDQLAAGDGRFALLQNRFRRFGMDIVGASVRRAQQDGHGLDLNPEHTALAIALLFERFTGVSLSHGLPDDAAITTLSTIWRKTLYGNTLDSAETKEN